MARLTTEARKRIPSKDFALPGRRYPIQDRGHARDALSRISEFGTPEEKAKVRAAVHRKYPGIGKRKTVPLAGLMRGKRGRGDE